MGKGFDRTMRQEVPCYDQIKKVLPRGKMGQQREREKKQSSQKKLYILTEHSPSGKAVLRKGVTVTQAARKLSAYEATGLTPKEVVDLMERERNLTRRVVQLESWQ